MQTPPDHAWAEKLLKELKQLHHPIPADEFKRLLGQLDDERFTVRERATTELLRTAEGAAPSLRAALKQPLSLEAATWVKRILAEVDKKTADPLRRSALANLEGLADPDSWFGPEARTILETLAKGTPEARLTRDAKAALQRPDKRATPPKPLKS